MKKYYDVIIIGAGPAGSTTAKCLAENQVKTLLLERGPFPGSKNMFGGAVYSDPLSQVIPAFWKDAPIERIVTKEELWFLDQDSAVRIGFSGLKYNKEPYNKLTVLRPKFDAWLAGLATGAGAILKNSVFVKDILYNKSITGKKTFHGVALDDGTEIFADTIILAEGAAPLLTQKTGLTQKMKTKDFFLYVKEVLSLPSNIIEERFNLEENEGAIYLLIGFPGFGRVSKIGIFTNSNSISLILGGYINHMMTARVNPAIILEKVKSHPLIKKLISGAVREEYMAKIIPKGGVKASPKVYADGLLLAGDTATMVSGRRGIDLAMLSGMYAADTIIQARAKGDFSEITLSNYQHKLNNTFFIKNMKRSPKTATYFEENPDADFLLSRTVNRLAYEYFHIGLDSDIEKITKLMHIAKDIQHPIKSLGDLYAGMKNWSV